MELKNKLDYIDVGITIANTVRSTLGVRGMNKMVMLDGKPILTNDGATIIKNLPITHPIADMFKGLAEGQERAIGDGTTTATLFAGQLLENAKTLLNKKIHPIIIINGYNIAKQEAINFSHTLKTRGERKEIIKTTFGSKINPAFAEHLTNLLPSNIERLRICKVENKEPLESKLIKGYMFDGYTINDRMPEFAQGHIAVLDLQSNLEFAKFQITSTDELNKMESNLKEFKRNLANRLKEAGVKIVFYTDTNPQFENFLTEAGLMAIVVYKREYLDGICKATLAQVIADPTNLTLGYGSVNYLKNDQKILIENDSSEIDTLILQAPTKQVLEETERAIVDVMGVLHLTNDVVYGAGAFELQISLHLKEFAKKIGGKEQIAIEKYAESIEAIPLILAENCGFDAMEVLTLLKTQHTAGNITLGVDPYRMIGDAKERGVVEPVSLKINALNSATEVANLILKLDDIYGERK